jgi:DMSO/TMAO reductase YedYZ molybdopterin-dependent catalytic subunit
MAKDDKPSGLATGIREKLIQAKQTWARQGRLLTGQTGDRASRLPPGQHEVKNWPVLDLGVQPLITEAAWELTIDGLVAQPLVWRFADFQAQPAFSDISDIHCVTAWSRYDNHWEGVGTRHLLALVQPKPEAAHVICHAHDGYTTNLTLEQFAAPDALLAYRWEGQPISREHGGPVRMVVPRYYFWKSAKWIRRLEFVAKDRPGFWEERGYHNEGDPWNEDRYS